MELWFLAKILYRGSHIRNSNVCVKSRFEVLTFWNWFILNFNPLKSDMDVRSQTKDGQNP